nr:WecB/TagA/CpsF family glycosyltransferase [Actibacterium ureilyticum]
MKHDPATAFAQRFAIPPPIPTRRVMGVPVVDASTRRTADWLLAGGARTVFFLNAHCANLCAGNAGYAAALERADAVLPDGIGIELAARMTGGGLTQNLNGTDFTPALLRAAAAQGKSVYLFGARPGTAAAAGRALARKIPGLRIAGPATAMTVRAIPVLCCGRSTARAPTSSWWPWVRRCKSCGSTAMPVTCRRG